ncbi:ATP-binding protein [Massilia sp. CFBP9012]|uniref:ATP-binding protein n=1 Tax=Massilia sp. CFBP9012 TaxID=3096531 RepID=UPI002A6B3227|nr:ATP-binding protein [Massilia sp. CFBP9012]MDY0976253.1 ATP-binding protein [Massilia sp. CFBP9012]
MSALPSSPVLGDSDLNWLAGGGEMGELIRSMDWSQTPLGPLSDWPQSLRTSVSLCLSSTFPILVCWGPDDIQIYNDAYRPICGDLHPGSMGAPFKVVWASALPVVGAAFERAHQGEGAYIKDQQMFLDRSGYLEEANMTFSFSPIRDESGTVGGVFHPITETTAQVLGTRRAQGLRDLTASLAATRSMAEIGQQLTIHVQRMKADVPFLLFYQIDQDSGMLELRGGGGLPPHGALAPDLAPLDNACWPFARCAATHAAAQVDDVAARLAGLTCGPYEDPPRSALVLPLSLPGQQELFGFVVAGVSVRRALDADYRNFYELLGAAVNTAVGNVLAYEQEQRRAEELAKIDRAKTAFFSNVSHEFRTPLTLILGPLEDALADDADSMSAAQRKRIEVTHRNALRLLKLVNSLLDFSRIEAGRVQASYVPVDLTQLTLDLAGVFESAMAKGGLEYRIALQDLGQPVYIDRDMWEKIVFNLLSNAFKFTLHGGVTISLREHEGMARLSVQDTGTGIPEHELPRMFERFHRIEGAPGRTYEGTGIGLALIQELVRLHGGTIAVSSTFGEGTRFDVDLPFGDAHLPQDRILRAADGMEDRQRMGAAFVEEALRWLPDAEAAPHEEGPAALVDMAGQARPRILIADDNNDMRAYLKALLEPHADVRACADGQAAFELALADPPDLLLSDVMMPKLDGFGLIAQIRASEALRLLPVMLLSARAGEEAKVEGLQAGADDYLVKPFSANELLARVHTQVAMGRERRQMERDARAREAHVRALIDASPAMLWTTDNEGQCTYLSQRWYDYTGRTPEQDLGLGWLENTHPDDRQRSGDIFLAANAARQPFSIDYRLRCRDGSYRWFIDAGLPRTNAQGDPDGYVGTVIDVHARKLLQERFERVSEAGDIGVWYADAPFTQLQINAEMAVHFGLEGARLASVDALLDAVEPEDRERLAASVEHAVRAGAPLDLEFRTMAGGAPRWLRAIGWCGLDKHGQPERFDGVTLDIDSQKHAEQELQRLASELGRKNRAQSDFLFTLAHELRNPLAPIRSGLELMRIGAASGDVQAIMRRQVDHMVHLVDDLLDMARLAEGKVTLKLERVLLADVVREAVDMSMPLMEARKHALTVRPPDASLALHADRHRVAQVLSNLLNNAAKYTPQGGAIEIVARIAAQEVAITVSDNGIGIAAPALETVFDMYAQAHLGTEMAQGGLGVGLNLVQRLVKLHGGRVAASSGGAGMGSQFTVWLPLPQDALAGLPVAATPEPATAPVPATPDDVLRILVVDDNVDAAETLQALLEMNDHTVSVANDGAAALRLAGEVLPQVVFLDIGLPDMSGHEAAEAMRRIPGMEDATLVALTGWGAEQDRRRSSEAGFDHHLTKPADFTMVENLIRDVATKKRTTD